MTRPDWASEAEWEKARAVMLDSPFAMEAADYFDQTVELIALALIQAKNEGKREAAEMIARTSYWSSALDAAVAQAISQAILSSLQKEPT